MFIDLIGRIRSTLDPGRESLTGRSDQSLRTSTTDDSVLRMAQMLGDVLDESCKSSSASWRASCTSRMRNSSSRSSCKSRNCGHDEIDHETQAQRFTKIRPNPLTRAIACVSGPSQPGKTRSSLSRAQKTLKLNDVGQQRRRNDRSTFQKMFNAIIFNPLKPSNHISIQWNLWSRKSRKN